MKTDYRRDKDKKHVWLFTWFRTTMKNESDFANVVNNCFLLICRGCEHDAFYDTIIIIRVEGALESF